MNEEKLRFYYDDILNNRAPKHIILDTDTYNEIDDQFALSYAIKADGVILTSVNAAPFYNNNSSSPEDGMEKSYDEIQRLFELTECRDVPSYKGARRYLTDEKKPEVCDAAQNIIARAMAAEGEPLYVLTIGCGTNVASALLMAPEIIDKICVVWLAGNSLFNGTTTEFNMIQDIAAARVIFDSGVPLVQIPCSGVCTHLAISLPELDHFLKGKNKLCDYLYEITRRNYFPNENAVHSKVIWDASTVAMMLVPQAFQTRIIPKPVITYDKVYREEPGRAPFIYTYMLDRDWIFGNMFSFLTK